MSAMRRQLKVVIACGVIGLACGTAYLIKATRLYTASANIIMDNRQSRVVHDVLAASPLNDTPSLDAPEVESQLEVVRSDKISLAVVKSLGLADDPTFFDPPKFWLAEVWANIQRTLSQINGSGSGADSGAKIAAPADPSVIRQSLALTNLSKNVRINRIGRTFVFEVEYTSPSPKRAAEIANAYAVAYVAEKANLRAESNNRARSGWSNAARSFVRHPSKPTSPFKNIDPIII